MTELKLVGIFLLGLSIIFGLIVLIADYHHSKEGCNIKISFQEFHFYYRVNPGHWNLYSGFVQYEYPVKYGDCSSMEHMWVCFPFWDYLIYDLWYWTHGRIKQKEEKDSYRKQFNELMKKELENYNKNLQI